MQKPLAKEGRDALFLYKKPCSKQTERGNCISLYCLNNFSFRAQGVFFLHLLSNKTRNCLFFDLLRGFLTLATLFGSYIFSYLSQ
ncbi:hypothetical protein FPI77_12010 [Klebsiella quasivariicola]|nr:hypothetical protein B8P98_25660 [Klebsiella quasivariicola]MBK2373269.1 hypothetical protein [Klebsiella quasivariicola]QBL51438.1 hypothetical protein BMD99_024515 [Klebsiella sp. PO552]TTN49768.1 hypothetical protein FPI77_12010 [Klebsiella quasivariicola]